MHQSSRDAMARALNRFVYGRQLPSNPGGGINILDVGSYDVNGTYRDYFTHPRFDYTGVDLEDGPNVDVVLSRPDSIPFDTGSVGLVISGQMLEHAPRFWEVFGEMARVLSPGGIMIVIAPSAGPEHRYPVDCYRYLPDSFQALGNDNGLTIVDIHINRWGPWFDLVGVFQKPLEETGAVELSLAPRGDNDAAQTDGAEHPKPFDPVGPREFLGGHLGIKKLIRRLKPRGILQVGQSQTEDLAAVTESLVSLHQGQATVEDRAAATIETITCSADTYFEAHHDPQFPLDIAIIYAPITLADVVRLFAAIEEFSNPDTVVVVAPKMTKHPTNQRTPVRASESQSVINAFLTLLGNHRPELSAGWGKGAYRELAIIKNLQSSSRFLREQYSNII